jgi:hypothetical protein
MEHLQLALERLENKQNIIYFLTYDTKGNARAAIKNIYDMALALKNNEYIVKILVEDKSYGGIENWLGDEYKNIEITSIKDDKVEMKVDDIIIVPEYYSNALPQLSTLSAIKIMLIQQKEYIFETLPIGSRWKDYGFDKCITTTKLAKKYIIEYFPDALIYLIPPYIDNIFTKADKPIKPYIAISCRDRQQHRKIISEFYLKFPQLRWITFRDMVQMSYKEFADALKECMVSLWIDDESTFGTFPLESMKCGVPVIGKIPDTEPEWLGENGMWTYDANVLSNMLATYILAWLEGIEITKDALALNEMKENMKKAYEPYTKENHTQNTLSTFNSIINSRIDGIKKVIEKNKNIEKNEKNNDIITNT